MTNQFYYVHIFKADKYEMQKKKIYFQWKKVHLQASESVVTNQAHHYFNFNFLIISGMN